MKLLVSLNTAPSQASLSQRDGWVEARFPGMSVSGPLRTEGVLFLWTQESRAVLCEHSMDRPPSFIKEPLVLWILARLLDCHAGFVCCFPHLSQSAWCMADPYWIRGCPEEIARLLRFAGQRAEPTGGTCSSCSARVFLRGFVCCLY